jgi:acetolactate synthase-1/2/3 large subunit
LPNEKLADKLDYDYLPDFCKLAEAHGAKAYRVIDPAKLDATMKKAVSCDGPALIEVIVEPRANVYPMIPSGRSVSEMIFEK